MTKLGNFQEQTIKKMCIFLLTKINISKGATPYLSPQPVFVPHSQLHGCKKLLSTTDMRVNYNKKYIQLTHFPLNYTAI